jgi:hypothetical protein
MPILVELTYEDGTTENFKYPAQREKVMIPLEKYTLLKKQSRKLS